MRSVGSAATGLPFEHGMKLLVLETTCDETAAAVIAEPLKVLSSVVASQDDLHGQFGGVVPEIASRAHMERILPVVDEALRGDLCFVERFGCRRCCDNTGFSRLVIGGTFGCQSTVHRNWQTTRGGRSFAGAYLCVQSGGAENLFPCVGLIVSGGHTSLYRCNSALDFTLLGGTIDDAAGEAFDKVASLLGLPYPGGPAIQSAATEGNPNAYQFPRAFVKDRDRLAFSFSGLKTAVRYQITPPVDPRRTTPATEKTSVATEEVELSKKTIADLAASFQEAVVDCLVEKSLQALEKTGLKTLAAGGGVAANARLRQRLEEACKQHGKTLHIAPRELCTDNAVMGAIALERLRQDFPSRLL